MRRCSAISVVALALLSVILALAADKPPHTQTILIRGFAFVPDRLTVSVGDTVVWKNEDIVPHTATAKNGFDSKSLDAGQSWSFVARQKGDYPYICTYHPTMTGELLVK